MVRNTLFRICAQKSPSWMTVIQGNISEKETCVTVKHLWREEFSDIFFDQKDKREKKERKVKSSLSPPTLSSVVNKFHHTQNGIKPFSSFITLIGLLLVICGFYNWMLRTRCAESDIDQTYSPWKQVLMWKQLQRMRGNWFKQAERARGREWRLSTQQKINKWVCVRKKKKNSQLLENKE